MLMVDGEDVSLQKLPQCLSNVSFAATRLLCCSCEQNVGQLSFLYALVLGVTPLFTDSTWTVPNSNSS